MKRTEDEVIRLLKLCTEEQRRHIFQYLRKEFAIHPLEAEMGLSAEMVLESISRAHPLTRRMIRGVFAEAAFEVEIVKNLNGWSELPVAGDPPYDFHLTDEHGSVTIQVKLQRSKQHRPMRSEEAPRWTKFTPGRFVVETQKTRRGSRGGEKTRPYRFGEFDMLAVAMQPSSGDWGSFMYTVADWLRPDPIDDHLLMKYQPVSATPDSDWTDRFEECVAWLRRSTSKRITL